MGNLEAYEVYKVIGYIYLYNSVVHTMIFYALVDQPDMHIIN